jgi:Tfp pilus assembly protein PilZ
MGTQPSNPATGVRIERRAAVRVPVRVAVSLMCIDRKVYGWVVNISAGGLYAQADERFPVGSRVLVDALLAMDHTVHHLKVEGRVAHHHGGGMGIEFVKPDSESVLFIRRLVTRLLFGESR